MSGRRLSADEPAGATEAPVLSTALAIGVVLMAVQLWVLTVALDLLLGGKQEGFVQLVAVSGVVFAGGLLVLKLLGVRHRSH